MKLLLATKNAHKLREFTRLLDGRVELEGLPDASVAPEETGSSYAANALIKARAAAQETGRAAFADDSGIEAETLGWAPGIYSARFSGEGATDQRNLDKLIGEVPAGSRLRYVCVIAHVEPGGSERTFEGVCEGTMAESASGAGGFGYDPVFVPDTHPGRTMAELSDAEKDAISHRGQAARSMLAWLLSEG